MKIEDILIKIKDYDDTINKIFLNKDVITITELIHKIEDYYCEIDDLKGQIDKLEHPDDGSDELYEAWKDYYS